MALDHMITMTVDPSDHMDHIVTKVVAAAVKVIYRLKKHCIKKFSF